MVTLGYRMILKIDLLNVFSLRKLFELHIGVDSHLNRYQHT